MHDEAQLQARHYRRGTILGLTLAELLMLLLFLFLLIMAFVITDKEQRLERSETERRHWRETLSDFTALSLPSDPATPLTEADLERPIEALRQINEESEAFRQMLATDIDVAQLRQFIEQGSSLDALAQAAGADSTRDFLQDMAELVTRSNLIRPGQSVAATLEEGLQKLGSGREACIRLPREPGQSRGSVAYSFVVTLTPEGVVARLGDEEAFQASWIGDLPLPPLNSPISVAEFNRVTRAYYDVGENIGAPVAGSSARRPCRFYIALERSRQLTDVDAYDMMLRRVQDNFYKRTNVELVD